MGKNKGKNVENGKCRTMGKNTYILHGIPQSLIFFVVSYALEALSQGHPVEGQPVKSHKFTI